MVTVSSNEKMTIVPINGSKRLRIFSLIIQGDVRMDAPEVNCVE